MYDVYQSLYPTYYNRWTRNPHYRDKLYNDLKNDGRLLPTVNDHHKLSWCSYDADGNEVSEHTNDQIHLSFYDGWLVGRSIE